MHGGTAMRQGGGALQRSILYGTLLRSVCLRVCFDYRLRAMCWCS